MASPSLQERARILLDKNIKSGQNYFYTAPSLRKYPHQWSWDSSFHAIANSCLGRVDLAQGEILTLLSSMCSDGRLPHLIYQGQGLTHKSSHWIRWYWPDPYRSPLVQPPVVALAVQKIWEQSEDLPFLKEILPLVEKHFGWLRVHRSSANSPLVSVFSPWESGLDHKPGFDRLLGKLSRLPLGLYIALYWLEWRLSKCGFEEGEIRRRRYFEVKEVLFNVFYALGLEALGKLFLVLGDRSKAEGLARLSQEVVTAILEQCYDPAAQLYFDIDGRTWTLVREPAISSLSPLALPGLPSSRREELIGHLTSKGEFWSCFPIPSVPLSSPHFRARGRLYLWRGPTWININWLIWEGLKRHGYLWLADELAHKTKKLVELSGFREYYDPLTGRGGGERDFSWSTLAAIM